jgi:hydrogenase nickel incorporation protein HypA/HybF
MHEVSLVQALFDQADHAIGSHPSAAVRQVSVRIGQLAGVEEELFRTAFEGCKRDRGYSNATLQVTLEPAVWSCRACSAPASTAEPLRCPVCGGAPELSAGSELILQRLELEVHDV